MKRILFPLFCLGLLLSGSLQPLGALEVEVTGGVDNLTFHPDRITAHGQSAEYKQFEGYPFLYGDLLVRGDITEKLKYEALLQRDNILLNTLGAKLSTNMDYFNIEFGPFVGIGDNLERPDVGIMGGIELALPGIVFLSINGSSTLGFRFDFLGDGKRETAEVKVGFWLPHMIAAFSVNTRSYTRRPEESLTLRDELTRFVGSVDFYAKNFPLILRADAGYEVLSRSYKWGNTETIDELGAVFVGVEGRFHIKQLCVIGGYEMPLRLNASAPMESPANARSLYKFKAGVSCTFF